MKTLTEETVLSDKTRKIVDGDPHGSLVRVKSIWASRPVGFKGE